MVWEVDAGEGSRAEVVGAVCALVLGLVPATIAPDILLLLLLLLAAAAKHLVEEAELSVGSTDQSDDGK